MWLPRKCDYRTDTHTDAGRSDPYVPLRFAGDTIIICTFKLFSEINFPIGQIYVYTINTRIYCFIDVDSIQSNYLLKGIIQKSCDGHLEWTITRNTEVDDFLFWIPSVTQDLPTERCRGVVTSRTSETWLPMLMTRSVGFQVWWPVLSHPHLLKRKFTEQELSKWPHWGKIGYCKTLIFRVTLFSRGHFPWHIDETLFSRIVRSWAIILILEIIGEDLIFAPWCPREFTRK